jgi:hypothetical protein
MNLNSIRSFKPAGFPSLSTTLPPYNTVTLLAIAALASFVTYLVCRTRSQQFEIIGPSDFVPSDSKCVIITPQNLGRNWKNLLQDVLRNAGMDSESAALLSQKHRGPIQVWRRVDSKDSIVMLLTDLECLGCFSESDTVFIISDNNRMPIPLVVWIGEQNYKDKFVHLKPTDEGTFELGVLVEVLKKCIQPKNA